MIGFAPGKIINNLYANHEKKIIRDQQDRKHYLKVPNLFFQIRHYSTYLIPPTALFAFTGIENKCLYGLSGFSF